jgi:bifunctional non-homologous end joining protein LigD
VAKRPRDPDHEEVGGAPGTALREYRRKRDFSVTPEPRGAEPEREDRSFVVQKHAASRLHYDFRLGMEGVLKSWAVPKGPSLDPAEKRLAMETEDHPLEYGDFEGVIPEGEYGGGTSVVWDRGTWEPVGDPHRDYRKGSMKFKLHGQKLRGGFALVKIRGRERRDNGKSWLLIKEKDEHARPGWNVVEALPDSAATGRTLEQVAADRDRVWSSNRAERKAAASPPPAPPGKPPAEMPREKPTATLKETPGAHRAALPDFVSPQLATLVDEPPEGGEWLHEMKLDGYRILCRVDGGKVRLLSRQGHDWTDRLPAVAEAARRLPARQALLDGEAAVVLPDGRTSFQALQNLMSGTGDGQLVYFVFDLLHRDGYDLTAAPLEARKALARDLLAGTASAPLRMSEHVVGSGAEVYAQACRLAMEGIVSKRREAPYRAGRSRDWLKVKCLHEQEVVIGGYTPPQGTRVGLGALLVGVRDDRGRLAYAGKVGTGFTEATLRELEERLRGLEQKESPFAAPVPGASRARWVRPDLVAQVAFGEWTSDGRMRHPSFRGLREDKPAREVVREHPSAAPRTRAATDVVAGVRLTHADRELYPEQGITKRDLALYYESIADWILPHVEGRPLTLVRCPDGAHEKCFYQKHTGHWAPDVLRRVKIREAKKTGEYLIVDDLPGLVGLVQIGILEIHTWNSTADRLEQPDRVVFDLDPDPAVPWERVLEAARRVRRRLEDLGLASFVKTTGGKGLHVVMPFRPGPSWEESAAFAEAVAAGIAAEEPRAYTTLMSKAARKGKIFIDYMRNYRGATSVAAYSTRARAGAPVSVPLRWEELSPTPPNDAHTVRNVAARLAALGEDPWADYWRTRQKLPSDASPGTKPSRASRGAQRSSRP